MSVLSRSVTPRMFYLIQPARWLLLTLAVSTFSLALVGTALYPAYATTHPEVLAPTVAWTTEATLASLENLGWSAAAFSLFYVLPFLLTLMTSGTMAIIILLRKADQWFGLFAAFVFILAAQGSEMFLPLFSRVPGIESWYEFTISVNWQVFFAFMLVFPDGKFVPRWTRWAFLGWSALILWSLFSPTYGPISTGLTFALVVISLGSQPYRYFRQAGAIQRQQTKWVVFAVMILLALLPLAFLNTNNAPAAGSSGPALLRSTGVLSAVVFGVALIPLSMGVAILRYRLWDIDVIIRRTLVYTVLTTLVALIYFGSVSVLQSLFSAVSDQRSPVSIVLSTLIIAALFTPLRRRVKDVIDRRFFRRKYDAERMLAFFAETARDEVDLESLTRGLLRTVEEAMQPAHVNLWLRPEGKPPSRDLFRLKKTAVIMPE